MKTCGCEFRIARRLIRDAGLAGSGRRPLRDACLAGSGRRRTQLRGCPPCPPRADDSSLMPLRRAPRRPDLSSCVDAQWLQGSPMQLGTAATFADALLTGVQPLQANPTRCRGGRGGWRSVDLGFCQIKGELSVIDRRRGHSRSYPARSPRLAETPESVRSRRAAYGFNSRLAPKIFEFEKPQQSTQ